MKVSFRLQASQKTGVSFIWIALQVLLTVVLLASCRSLPIINTASNLTIPAIVKDNVSDKELSNSDFVRFLALEEHSIGDPLTEGNKAVLLHDGPDTYRAMLAAISDARININMETYIFEDDSIGRQFSDTLIAKQRQGVAVSVIRDSIGTLNTSNDFFTRLSDAGIKVLEFNPINPFIGKGHWSINQRDHRKLLVVDGKIAFLGGINISSVYSNGSSSHKVKAPTKVGWRDTDIQLQGPVVAQLQKLFLDTWKDQGGDIEQIDNWFPALPNKGNAMVRAVSGLPSDKYNNVYASLISAFKKARTEIWITNAYFVPDPQLIKVLKKAAGRGVDVRLILPSISDSWLVTNASRSHYTELLKAGVKLYQRGHALLHAKTVVVDGVWSTVGSANLDWRSFLHNQEANVVVLDVDFGAQMREAFLADINQSSLLTLSQWKNRPITSRFGELMGRIWEYWL